MTGPGGKGAAGEGGAGGGQGAAEGEEEGEEEVVKEVHGGRLKTLGRIGSRCVGQELDACLLTLKMGGRLRLYMERREGADGCNGNAAMARNN